MRPLETARSACPPGLNCIALKPYQDVCRSRRGKIVPLFSTGSVCSRLLALACIVALSGCAAQQHELLGASKVKVPASEIAADHTIFVATTRAPSEDPRKVFSGRRSPTTAYVTVDVSVPAIHKPGRIERPTGDVTDPAKYFTATNVTGYRDEALFSNALRSQIRANGGNAMVFIHGFNTQFDDAIYRITQIAHDTGYKGTPVLFTWASAGRPQDYVYDTNSATAARDALEETLRLVARSGATRVDIVAHSLGNWATMEALRQLAMTKDRNLSTKLGDVILAAPDIDVDVFKSQMRRYGKPRQPFIVLAAHDDRALDISSWIAGNQPRLGDYLDAKDIASYGVVVVDISAIAASGQLHHTTFANNPALIKLLGKGLNEDDAKALGASGDVTQKVQRFVQGLGQTSTSAADILITTPAAVMRVAVGQ